VTATTTASMIVADVDLRSRVGSRGDPIDCEHVWEPHLWDTGRAYCHRCGSFARWVNDPRASEEQAS
jgi:hypothetical protein